MSVPPRFAVRDGYALYRGPVADGPIHRHCAFQIAIAIGGEVTMADSAGIVHRGPALLVAPMAPHRIGASPDLLSYYVDPRCAFADTLRDRYDRGIHVAPELSGLREDDVAAFGAVTSSQLDPRLITALELLRNQTTAIPDIAAAVDLSPQRLRSLARGQLGMPLARWRVWSRLRRAVEAMQGGASLIDAAVTAGFSDQAHLSRQMRDMMGLTPAAVAPLLAVQPLTAT